jgi:hypothetical protein
MPARGAVLDLGGDMLGAGPQAPAPRHRITASFIIIHDRVVVVGKSKRKSRAPQRL